MKISGNRFESFSLLASRERWCWNLACTTCGHMVFRWGLKALAKGLHPDDPRWPVHQRLTRRFRMENGSLPPGGAWPEDEQRLIQDAVRGCSLQRLAERSSFPDWLGHVGVVLYYTEDAERGNLFLTQELVPQLARLIEPGSTAETMLRQHLDTKQPLRWSDLDAVEHCYRGPRPHRGTG